MRATTMSRKTVIFALVSVVALLIVGFLYKDTVLAVAMQMAEITQETAEEPASHGVPTSLLFLPIVLLAAAAARLVEKAGQPSVLGELMMGVLLGNLTLVGINFFEPIKTDHFMEILKEIGVVVLLFQVGLESNIHEMYKVGIPAFLVAIIGVVIPFFLGAFLFGPWLLPGLEQSAYLFLGAALVATSVGITARVFQELKKLQTKEVKIVLGAAVIDDVLGLIILAVVSAIAVAGSVSAMQVGLITGKAILFLVGAIVIGSFVAPHISRIFSKINTGVGVKAPLALSFGLITAYLAGKAGLAPIVGAFAAGLVLDPVHFKFFRDPEIVEELKSAVVNSDQETKNRVDHVIKHHAHSHVEELIRGFGHYVIPVFFVLTGMSVALQTLFDVKILMLALAITAVAIFGKIVSGIAAGKGTSKMIVGWGMVPRGEVGLIFATIGLGIGVISGQLFSIIVIMVILTTLIPPPILASLLRKSSIGEGEKEVGKKRHVKRTRDVAIPLRGILEIAAGGRTHIARGTTWEYENNNKHTEDILPVDDRREDGIPSSDLHRSNNSE